MSRWHAPDWRAGWWPRLDENRVSVFHTRIVFSGLLLCPKASGFHPFPSSWLSVHVPSSLSLCDDSICLDPNN